MDNDSANSEQEKQQEAAFVSLENKRVGSKFIKRWTELASDTGKGFVTFYMNDKKFSNMVIHKDDKNL